MELTDSERKALASQERWRIYTDKALSPEQQKKALADLREFEAGNLSFLEFVRRNAL